MAASGRPQESERASGLSLSPSESAAAIDVRPPGWHRPHPFCCSARLCVFSSALPRAQDERAAAMPLQPGDLPIAMKIEDALNLGRANEQAKRLVANHCLHADVTVNVSPLGHDVGLPIGRAEIRCSYAPFFGMSAVDLTSLAVEFYEQNCIGCAYRKPSGQLPTLASEAERRRQERDEADSRALALKSAAHEAWAARKARREVATQGAPYLVQDLANRIALMDTDPSLDANGEGDQESAEARRRVLETARATPSLFSEVLVDTIVALAENFDRTAHTVLRTLAETGVVPKERAASIAAETLRHGALHEAGQTVAVFSTTLTAEEIAGACPNAIWLASEPDLGFGKTDWAAEPAAILALAKRSWETVRAAVLEALEDGDPWRREAGAHAARHLLRDDVGRLVDLGEPLIHAVREPDDGHAGQPRPAAAVVRAFANAWLADADASNALLEAVAPSLTDEIREILGDVPRIVFRGDDGAVSDAARRSAVKFLVRRLDGGWGADAAGEAGRELEWVAQETPAALLPHVDALIGALIRECAPLPLPSVLLPAIDPGLRDLERRAALTSQASRRGHLVTALGHLAKVAPDAVLPHVLTLLDATTGEEAVDTTTQQTLIGILEEGVTAETVARTLPRLYTYLLASDQVVRAAAIRLWQACARVTSTLPDDLAVLAPSLLRDSYVIVHGAMTHAVRGLGLSDATAHELLGLLIAIAHAHRSDGYEEILSDALLGVLWAVRSGDEELRIRVAAFVIEFCSSLDPYLREKVILHRALVPYRDRPAWAAAAMQLLADGARAKYSISPRDDRVLAALVDEPRGLSRVPFALFRDIAAIHGPRSLGRTAEMIELLQASGRWREALQLATEVSATVPQTEDFRTAREFFASVITATAAECAVHEGRQPDYGTATVDSETQEHESPRAAHTRARAIVRAALGALPSADPTASAQVVEYAADLMDRTPGGDARVDAYSHVLRIVVQLLRYDAAVRAAASEAERLLTAARRSAVVLRSALETSLAEDDPVRQFVDGAATVTPGDLDNLLARVARIPLALPYCDGAFREPRRAKLEASGAHRASNPDEAPLAVCVLALNGSPVIDVQVLREERVHDLALEMRLEEWPEWAEICRVELLSTLPLDVLDRPTFVFRARDAHEDFYGVLLSQTGTLNFRSTRPPGGEPLDLTLHVVFTSADGHRREVAVVAGYERLRLRPYDPSRDVITHHAQMDQGLIAMFAELHADNSLASDDVEAFCRLYAACVRAGQMIMFDKVFRAGTRITEKQFHDALEERLRKDPELGGRLTRRDAIAGGFDDLKHDEIVAELKVEKTTARTVQDCERYIGQPAQYGVGRGSRLSILVVLDHTKKTAPAAVLENHIGWVFPAQHGRSDPRYPSRVGVLIINTNWSVPSAFSRRKVATRPEAPPSSSGSS